MTVAGGPACDFPAAQTIAENITCMDYVLSGLGLVSFPRLLHSLFVKKSEEVNHISGVFTRTNSTLLRDRKDWYGEELDINVKLDLDYRSFFESLNRFDSGSISPMLFFETSRGCWWAEQKRCLFCDINGTETKYCVKDSRIALDELQRLFSHRDRCKLYWATDSVIPEIYLDQVFPYLGEEMQSIKIFYEVRADISLLHIQKMAENHLCYVQAGIESLIGRTLKRLNKGVTPEGNLVFLRRCSQYGIHVLWNILVGLPSEQETDYSDYLPLIPKLFHLPPPSGIWSISYQRNSEYYCNQEKYGVKLISKNVPEKYLYPFPEQKISDLVYIYSNTQIGLIFRPKIIKYIQKIDWMIQKWKQRWLAGAPPFLFIRNHILFDSRQTEKETPLKPKEEEILHVLESPKNIYDICRETGLSYNRVQKYLYYLEQVLECIYFNPDTQCYVSLATEGRPILKKPLIPESFEEFMKAE